MKLETLLKQRGIAFEKSSHRAAYTSQQLAAEEHTSGYNVAKPVLVKSGKGFTMCVLPACARLDLARVGEVLNAPDVRLATETEMTGLFPDCELGAEPPVGSMFGMKTVMDERLCQDEFVLMQGGTHTESIKLRREDWESLCEPVVASISHL